MSKAIIDYDKKIKKSFTFYLFVFTVAILFFPWGVIAPSLVGGGAFFEYRGLSYVLILFLLLVFLFENNEFRSKKTSFYLPIIFISAGILLSLIPHTNIAATSEMAIYLCAAVGLGFLANYFGYIEEHRQNIVFALIIIMLGLSLYGVYQYFVVFPALKESNPSINRMFDFRLTSVLTNPTAFASLIVMTWPVVLFLWSQEKRKLYRFFYAFCLVIFFFVLSLTFSKSGIIALIIQVLLMLNFFYKQKRTFVKNLFLPVITLLLMGLFGSLPVVSNFSNKTTSYLVSFQTSLSGRIALWKSALKMFLSSPLTGVGGFAFKDAIFKYQVDGFYSTHAHSSFLQMFAETGLIGGLGFLLLGLYLFLRCCFFNKNISLSKFIGFGTVGFLLMNIVDSLLYYELIGYYFALTIGIAYSEIDKPVILHRDFPRGAFKALFFLLLILSFMVNLAYYTNLAGKNLIFSDYEEGLKYLKASTLLFPIEAEYHRSLSQAYSIGALSNKTYRLQRIIEMKRAIFLQPYNPKYYFELGYFYETEGQPELAAYFYRKAISCAPKQPFYSYQIGRLYYENLKTDLARKYFLQTLSLSRYFKPQYVRQSYLLGNSRSEYDPYLSIARAALLLGNIELSNQNIDKALNYYEIAIKWNPNLADAYAAQASVYIRKGVYEKAATNAEKAIKLQPKEPGFYYLAAVAYYNLGSKDIALLYIEEAIKLDPHNESYLELYQKLKEREK
jgi:tetratricopeptide (TPR) repeat protein/O-antigen ligase